MKTIIEDLVVKMEGGTEVCLPENTTIRFEFGETSLSCKVTENGLEIYKMYDSIGDESKIMTVGESSNRIIVK